MPEFTRLAANHPLRLSKELTLAQICGVRREGLISSQLKEPHKHSGALLLENLYPADEGKDRRSWLVSNGLISLPPRAVVGFRREHLRN